MQRLSTILNLELAWKRVKNDQYNDLLPDILQLMDVDYDIGATLNNIRERIKKGYQPSAALHIDVPKRTYTLRPACTMVPEDRILYQALIDFVSRKIEEPPYEACFSYRLNKNPNGSQMFQFWRDRWLEMRKKMRETFANGYCCLLKTDIAAYFEQIDHDIFISHMNGKIREGQVIYLLRLLLRNWAISEVKHIGIPQGCDASSYIGNFYLIDVDKVMVRGGFKYFRYSDEIRVLTRDKREARKAIQLLTHELRKLHLNLQDAKTDIIDEPEKVTEQIGTEEEDKRRDFDYALRRKLRKGEIEESEGIIIDEYKKATKNGRAKEVDGSKLRWSINRLAKIKNDLAVNFLLSRLAELAIFADLYFEYLQLFVNRPSVKDKIIDFLASENNIYEWQEMWLFLTLSKSRKLDDRALQLLRSIITKKEKHWAARAAAIFTLGKLGDDTDRKWLRGQYHDEDNNYLKRAIVVSVRNLPKSVRNSFYSEIENDSYGISRLVKYMKQERIRTI